MQFEAAGVEYVCRFDTAAKIKFEELHGTDFTALQKFFENAENSRFHMTTLVRAIRASVKTSGGDAVDYDAACALVDEMGMVETSGIIVRAFMASLPADDVEDGESGDGAPPAAKAKGGKAKGNGKGDPKG